MILQVYSVHYAQQNVKETYELACTMYNTGIQSGIKTSSYHELLTHCSNMLPTVSMYSPPDLISWNFRTRSA